MYLFTNGTIKLANKRFTSIKNDYSITFDRSSIVEIVPEDKGIVKQGFNFTELKKIEEIV